MLNWWWNLQKHTVVSKSQWGMSGVSLVKVEWLLTLGARTKGHWRPLNQICPSRKASPVAKHVMVQHARQLSCACGIQNLRVAYWRFEKFLLAFVLARLLSSTANAQAASQTPHNLSGCFNPNTERFSLLSSSPPLRLQDASTLVLLKEVGSTERSGCCWLRSDRHCLQVFGFSLTEGRTPLPFT